MELKQIVEIVKNKVPEARIEELVGVNPTGFSCSADHLIEISKILHTHPDLYFDLLSCVTGMDNGPEVGTMEVIYNLASIPFNHQLTLKVIIPRPEHTLPEAPSLSTIWKTAEWHEREAYDLIGINFVDHPDMRRLFLPADWEGHPLRKDYKNLEVYHGIKVEY